MLPALRLLAVGIGSALVANCLTLLFRPALIGRGGERAVRLALARLGLPALHDVVLADALGHTQIDHLVRTTQGIVVIETKTFSGWITGTLYSAEWTQHLAGGRIRHRFQNPVRQNHRHCKAVEAAITGLTVPVHGRIVGRPGALLRGAGGGADPGAGAGPACGGQPVDGARGHWRVERSLEAAGDPRPPDAPASPPAPCGGAGTPQAGAGTVGAHGLGVAAGRRGGRGRGSRTYADPWLSQAAAADATIIPSCIYKGPFTCFFVTPWSCFPSRS